MLNFLEKADLQFSDYFSLSHITCYKCMCALVMEPLASFLQIFDIHILIMSMFQCNSFPLKKLLPEMLCKLHISFTFLERSLGQCLYEYEYSQPSPLGPVFCLIFVQHCHICIVIWWPRRHNYINKHAGHIA